VSTEPSSTSGPIPLIVVVSGPSGVGKDTLLERMEETHSDLNFHFVVTATTRLPREGERDGINHLFLSRIQFEMLLEDGQLLEHAEVYGNYYGVPRRQVVRSLEEGKHVILRVDYQGAERIRLMVPEALFVFVMPPDKETLQTRLIARGQDTPESIGRRMASADHEMEVGMTFDYQITNHDGQLDELVEELVGIIETESRRDPPRQLGL
jgi:guanylate kinase